MTQFYIDSDNGIDTADGLAITRTGTTSITSSSVANPSNILCVAHGMVSTESTTIAGHSGSTPDINADHVITRVDDDNFTIPVNVTVGGTGGTSQELDGPFASMDQFTENTRSAGDIAACRRGATATYNAANGLLGNTSDGTSEAPITLEADYDDNWSDDVTADQTYTMVFGSKVHTASATITTLAASEWIYVVGDDQKLFAYEVDSVATDQLTLFLPFKGTDGAGKSLTVMLAAPVFGDGVETGPRFDLSNANGFIYQGLELQCNATQGCVEFDASGPNILRDLILDNNGKSNTVALNIIDDSPELFVSKVRTFDSRYGIRATNGSGYNQAKLWNCLFDCNNVSSGEGYEFNSGENTFFDECEFKRCAIGDVKMTTNINSKGSAHMRNCVYGSTTKIDSHHRQGTSTYPNWLNIEDFNGTLNDTRFFSAFSDAEGTPEWQSETTTVRTGGSTISTKVTPGISHGIIGHERSARTILDIPIFATTASKKYEIFFRPDATANWTANPTRK